MRVIYGIGNLGKGPLCRKVVTVGVFDGVHRGHQLILNRVVQEARQRYFLSAVVTFASHPSQYFHPRQKIPALTSLEHRLMLIEKQGIQLCYVIDFNRAFAHLSPESFIRGILLEKIQMASFYVGEDFIFGRGGRGNIRLLAELSEKFQFELHVLKALKLKRRIVSSTLIRGLIKSGRLKQAKIFLGRPVSFLGEVIRGEGRGRLLGFPTANIRPHHEVLAPDGIYATETCLNNRFFHSVTYLGTKSTFKKRSKNRSIEVFLFGLCRSIYGQKMEISFVKKIREDQRFHSKEALVAQIRRDIAEAKNVFKKIHFC